MENEEQEQPPVPEQSPVEGNRELEKIHDDFYGLASAIEVCNSNLLSKIRQTVTINKMKFFMLNKEQDEDLFLELANINKLLGKARGLLNAYWTVENTLPDFPTFFNALHEIETLFENQKKTIFYHVYSRDEGKYLYPIREIENRIKMFHTMLGGVCGTLQAAGDFLRDSQYLAGMGDNNGSSYNNGGMGRNGMGAPEPQDERALGM